MSTGWHRAEWSSRGTPSQRCQEKRTTAITPGGTTARQSAHRARRWPDVCDAVELHARPGLRVGVRSAADDCAAGLERVGGGAARHRVRLVPRELRVALVPEKGGGTADLELQGVNPCQRRHRAGELQTERVRRHARRHGTGECLRRPRHCRLRCYCLKALWGAARCHVGQRHDQDRARPRSSREGGIQLDVVDEVRAAEGAQGGGKHPERWTPRFRARSAGVRT